MLEESVLSDRRVRHVLAEAPDIRFSGRELVDRRQRRREVRLDPLSETEDHRLALLPKLSESVADGPRSDQTMSMSPAIEAGRVLDPKGAERIVGGEAEGVGEGGDAVRVGVRAVRRRQPRWVGHRLKHAAEVALDLA